MTRNMDRGDGEVDDADIGGAVDFEVGRDDAAGVLGLEGGRADRVVPVQSRRASISEQLWRGERRSRRKNRATYSVLTTLLTHSIHSASL